MLVGMTLGVAVVFAVDLANSSAKRAFALSLDTVTGRTTHHIVGTEGIDEAIYTRLRTDYGVRNSAPIVQGAITLIGNTKTRDSNSDYTESLQLLGVDIFAEPMFRDQGLENNSSRDSLKLLKIGSVILSDSTADRLGIKPSDFIRIKDHELKLRLINTVDSEDQPGFENIAMADISTAQEVLSMHGKLTRIDLILPLSGSLKDNMEFSVSDGTKEQQQDIDFLEASFDNISVTDAARQKNSLTQMTAAFHTNLQAMSLLALLVGAFLIYNTVTLSVIQRRQTFGQLRAIGLQRHELFRSILTETLAFAVIGTLAGVIAGYWLGNGLLTLVTRTINDLYFTLDVRQAGFSGFSLLKACLIGLVVSVLAALAPAIEASRSPPGTVIRRTTVERQISRLVPVIFVVGIALIVLGSMIIWISTSSLWAGFAAIFCIVLGYGLMVPQVLNTVTSLNNPSNKKGNHTGHGNGTGRSNRTMGNYPLRSMTASLSRTAVAITALAVSVSATAGVGIMIGSFRLSVEHWLDNTLEADIYISAVADDQAANAALPENLAQQIALLNGISGIREARMTEVETHLAPARLMAIRTSGEAQLRYEFKASNNQSNADDHSNEILTDTDRINSLNNSNAVIASEPFANKLDITVGDKVKITTDNGVIPFTVVGIFTNYTTGKGLLITSLGTYHKHWNDRLINSVGVNFTDDGNKNSTVQGIRSLITNSDNSITMRSDADIRDRSLEIFDRTFAITHVLRLLTIGVAFVGILSALMALSLERRAEYAGIIMSQILVSIINVRSFGWSMEYSIPPMVLVESLILAVVAALLAGLYPAHKLSRLSPAEALRNQ